MGWRSCWHTDGWGSSLHQYGVNQALFESCKFLCVFTCSSLSPSVSWLPIWSLFFKSFSRILVLLRKLMDTTSHSQAFSVPAKESYLSVTYLPPRSPFFKFDCLPIASPDLLSKKQIKSHTKGKQFASLLSPMWQAVIWQNIFHSLWSLVTVLPQIASSEYGQNPESSLKSCKPNQILTLGTTFPFSSGRTLWIVWNTSWWSTSFMCRGCKQPARPPSGQEWFYPESFSLAETLE